MVYVSGIRGRGPQPRGRGRGIGGVAFQSSGFSGDYHNSQTVQRQSHHASERFAQSDANRSHQPQEAESLRITVGNEQYKDKPRDEHNPGITSPSLSRRLGPPVDSTNRGDMHMREPQEYGQSLSDRRGPYSGKAGDSSRQDMYPSRGSSIEKNYNHGFTKRNDPASFRSSEGARSTAVPNVAGSALFPAGAKPLGAGAPIYPSSSSGSPSVAPKQSPADTRPLKSILKRKADVVPEKPEKPAGLPGIANYMDIDDEEKFLYGEDDSDKRSNWPSDRGETREQRHMSETSMRSAAQAWQPTEPERTGVASKYVNKPTDIGHAVQQQGYESSHSQYVHEKPAPLSHTKPAGSEDGNIWNLLAKSVQTAQQLPVAGPAGNQTHVAEYESQKHQSLYPPATDAPIQSSNEPPPSGTPVYDPTIENILKSIGFDFDMSKRMQEKAKLKPEEQFDVNQMSSFLGGGMSHEEMKSKLLEKGKAGAEQLIREAQESLARDLKDLQDDGVDNKRPGKQDEPHSEYDIRGFPESDDTDRRGVKTLMDEADVKIIRDIPAKNKDLSKSRDRWDSNDRHDNSDDDRHYVRDIGSKDTKLRRSRERRDSWDASTYTADMSPQRHVNTQKMSPRTKFQRDLSPVSTDESPPPMFNLPPITIKRKTSLDLDTSPGWEKQRSSSRSPPDSFKSRDIYKPRSRSPSWNTSNKGENSPQRKRSRSPVITRVFNLSPRDKSPFRSRYTSPGVRGRSHSPRRRGSPQNRRPSPRRRSRSPFRRSRSPRRRSRSPQRRRSISPRGRKRSLSPKDRSRERKISRSHNSRDRGHRSLSREKGRSRSSSRHRQRSRSGGRSTSPPKRGRSRNLSSSGSDTDNKSYFTSPLQGPPRPIPGRYYSNVPVPTSYGPPVDAYGYPIPPPPVMPQYGIPPGPPPMAFPPPGFPPPSAPFSVPFNVPPPTLPPPSSELPPPGAFVQIPLNVPPPAPADIAVHEPYNRHEAGENTTHKAEKSEVSERVVKISAKPKKKFESQKREAVTLSSKEKEKLQKDIEERQSKIQALEIEMENLKKQQNEQMRKKQKEKDGHKDPILIENNELQEAISVEINKLKMEQACDSKLMAAEVKEKSVPRTIKLKESDETRRDNGEKKSVASDNKQKERQMMKYSFVDKGEHWCKDCRAVFNNIHEYIEHLSSSKHKQVQSSDLRPWREGMEPYEGMIVNKKGIQVPLPGVEFLVPTQSYYCILCKKFIGDVSCGIDHFRCESHYFNYQNYIKENKYYEKKRLLEKEAGLAEISRSRRISNDKSKEERYSDRRSLEKRTEKEVDSRRDIKDSSETTKRTFHDSNKSDNLDKKNKRPGDKKAGFGKFTWVKPEGEETDENAEKPSQDTSTKSDESKKGGINIQLSSKHIPKVGGYTKQNPLLPPWQPVGKKTESFTLRKAGKLENEDPENLDMFVTGADKVPVGDKKKITAKEILEAFSGKYKDKDIQPKNKSADDEDANKTKHTTASGNYNKDTKGRLTSNKEYVASSYNENKFASNNITLHATDKPQTSSTNDSITRTVKMTSKSVTKEESKVGSSNDKGMFLGSIPLPTKNVDTPKQSDKNILSTMFKGSDSKIINLDNIPLPRSNKAANPDYLSGNKSGIIEKDNVPSKVVTNTSDKDAINKTAATSIVSGQKLLKIDTDKMKNEKISIPETTRGRKPTRGRGRGRGTAVSERRSTRQTRSMATDSKAANEPETESTSPEPVSEVDTNTKCSKKNESPTKRRRTSSGPRMEVITVKDSSYDDVSDFSDVSMEMGSDFEVLDDIGDDDET